MGNHRPCENRGNLSDALHTVCGDGQGQPHDTTLDGFVVRQRGTGRVISLLLYENSYLLVPLCLIDEFKPRIFQTTAEASIFIRYTLESDTDHYSICSVRMMYAERGTSDVDRSAEK